MKALTQREITLLEAASKYGISTVGKVYYKLGGHGYVDLPYNWRTLTSLASRGLVQYNGYWKTTPKGVEAINPQPTEQVR